MKVSRSGGGVTALFSNEPAMRVITIVIREYSQEVPCDSTVLHQRAQSSEPVSDGFECT